MFLIQHVLLSYLSEKGAISIHNTCHHLNTQLNLVWYLNGIWIPDHSVIGQLLTIQIPGLSGIQIPNAFRCHTICQVDTLSPPIPIHVMAVNNFLFKIALNFTQRLSVNQINIIYMVIRRTDFLSTLKMVVWIMDHLTIRHICDLNTGLVSYLDPHCIGLNLLCYLDWIIY